MVETIKILFSVFAVLAMVLTAFLAITQGINKRVINSFSVIILASLLTGFSEEISVFISPYISFSNFDITTYILSSMGVAIALYYLLYGDRRKSY